MFSIIVLRFYLILVLLILSYFSSVSHMVTLEDAPGVRVTCMGSVASRAKSLHLNLMEPIPIISKEEYYLLNEVAVKELLKEILIANLFLEVFPIDLPRLSSQR